MKAVLIQQIYPDTPGVGLMELTHDRHQQYCEKWGFDFWWKIENSLPGSDPLKGSWAKVELIKQALYQYEYIVWLDADTLISDLETDLRDGAPINGGIGACWHRIPQLNHWNVGALYIRNLGNADTFIHDWLTQYPGVNDGWNEQGVFNRLAMQSRVVETISDRWNATINFSEVPDAVVLGYHGAGDTKSRLELMRAALAKIEQREKARMSAPVMAEVTHGP